MKSNLLKFRVLFLVLAINFSSCDKEEESQVLGCDCADELFYYVSDEKLFLDDRFLNDWLLVGFESQIQDSEIVNFINQADLFKPVDASSITSHARSEDDYHMMFVNTKKPKTCSQLKEIISTLEKSPIVAYATLSFKGISCFGFSCMDYLAFSHYFLVAVKDKDDLSDLYTVAEETNTWIKGTDQFNPNYFILRANKNSNSNTIQILQYFNETGKFLFADPNFFEAKDNR